MLQRFHMWVLLIRTLPSLWIKGPLPDTPKTLRNETRHYETENKASQWQQKNKLEFVYVVYMYVKYVFYIW